MNLKKIFTIFALVHLSLSANGMVEFVKKGTGHTREYQPIVTHNFDAPLPQDLKKTLDENYPELTNDYNRPVMLNWLPGWWIKPADSDYTRLRDAREFAKAINVLNCDRINLPRKHKYKSPNGNTFVIAQSVPGYLMRNQEISPVGSLLLRMYTNKTIPLDEIDVSQLYEIAYKLRWWDFKIPENIIKMPTHGTFIVDTELTQFNPNLKGINLRLAIINRMLRYTIEEDCTKKAHNFLCAEKNRLLSKSSESSYVRLLKSFTKGNQQLINKVKSINHFNNFAEMQAQK